MKKLLAGVMLALVGLVVTGGAASATQPDPEHKVGLCHRTASDTNPYVYIEVDEASLDAHLNNLPGHPAKFNEDGSPRNDYLAESADDCVVTEPSPTPTPTPTDPPPTSPPPTPTETWTPTWTPTWSPSGGATPGEHPLAQTGIDSKAIAAAGVLFAGGLGLLWYARKLHG